MDEEGAAQITCPALAQRAAVTHPIHCSDAPRAHNKKGGGVPPSPLASRVSQLPTLPGRRLRAMPAIPTAPAPGPARILLARHSRLPVFSPSPSPCSSHHQLPTHLLRLPLRHRAAAMSAEARASESPVAPPAHPTYDLKAVIALALSEDAGDRGDVSCLATIPSDVEAEATFIAKADGVIAGISLADMIFNQVDPSLKVQWFESDGNFVHKGFQFGKVHGCARSIIVAERVVLNFMQRMSGIATLTKAMSDAARPACILETRKTAPGLRLVDKWAVLIGGGKNHRLGLFDMVMIKDNHISVAGGIANAMRSVDQFLEKEKLALPVEVETRTIEEVKDVLKYAAENKTSLTRIMLDNMVVPLPNGDVDVSMLKDAVQLINGKFETEASGNVTIDTVKKIGETGVTYISSGALTHSVKALDISLKIDTELALQVGRRTNRA
ncbi:nicotinate-nucleotide pyrophosphorylase [carboxylating], chloroplastic isoform X2 [Phragmites australis]|uniref:nicotinate-nucleotide pyrophosphorylase [carboxylating], chloroplastic isoform X2 n=1 Tax=Phragmites australis TaxID=29695 RepID=UPI002D77E367|nr:nicotinate-nucleotide pyrophosphorylase [carboxylating], chloroplastic isoform X2 [Phragmites australis]